MGEFEQIEILPGDDIPSEEDAQHRIELITNDMASKIRLIVKMMREDKGEEPGNTELITPEEKEEAIKGEIKPAIIKNFPS